MPFVLVAPLAGGPCGRGATGGDAMPGFGAGAKGTTVGLPDGGGAFGLLIEGIGGLLSGVFGPADATATSRPDAFLVILERWPTPAEH